MLNLNYFIILTIFLNRLNLIQSDELIELNCFNETQCKQFQHSGIKSTCIEEQCTCTSTSGDIVKCQPLNLKVNNIIGGPCPCQLPNAECDVQQDVCYCANNYMPSGDRRRCLAKIVALGYKCELDSQCQKTDFNAICHESKVCMCMEQFVNNEGKCASIIGLKSFCTNDTQCLEEHGANTKCFNQTHHCICEPDHYASLDNKHCLKSAKYLEECTENIQCKATMGLGGKCVEKACQCSEKYFVEEMTSEEGSLESVCTAMVERGQYCRRDEDCYQRQLNETDQSLDCNYGECNCKKGYYSLNEGDCIRGSGVGNKSMIGLISILFIIVFVNTYF